MERPDTRRKDTMRTLTGFMLALLFAPLLAAQGTAFDGPQVTDLSVLDRQWMLQQRQLVEDLARSHLGRSFSGDRDRDLDTLQALLDRGLVRPDQTRELQAMGVIMGELFAAELGLHWVVYEDAVGRSRALRDGATDNYLFPMTMIARYREVGNKTPVAAIYARGRDIVLGSRPPAPYR